MPFHSLTFIFLFLPVTVGGYFTLNRFGSNVGGKIWLAAASLFFYGWWNPIYVPILLFSMTVNYFISRQILPDLDDKKNRTRQAFLVLGIVFNLALLAYFKYMNFFIANLNLVLNAGFPDLHILFPIGVSFFTLQQIAFLVDTFEGMTARSSVLDYLLFTSFFPYLTAGPITHRKDIMPLLTGAVAARPNFQNIATGLFLFSIGLFKKVIIAGLLDGWVNETYVGGGFGVINSWIVSLSYMLQLYFDFSGYSDMALGLALLFNVHLPINFNSPLKAWNIVEFWRRWHISLANFMRVYVFSAALRSRSVVTFGFSLWMSFVTMFIMGIWHGAGWNYVLFGVMHGLAMVIYGLWAKTKIKLPKLLGWFLLFNFINLSLVPVRAGDLHTTLRIMKGMIGLNGLVVAPTLEPVYSIAGDTLLSEKVSALLCFLGIALFAKNSMEIVKSFKPDAETLLFVLFLFVISVLKISHVNEFIYFQF